MLKSGFSLNKLVSTTGQPSPALKLEGAGFTIYRISKLSKAAQFKQNPDGSYNAQSILDAYRKDNYDNATLKYDFTAEGQAIANMFESSTDTINAYNATLTADGDYANGRGNGWMPTDQPVNRLCGLLASTVTMNGSHSVSYTHLLAGEQKLVRQRVSALRHEVEKFLQGRGICQYLTHAGIHLHPNRFALCFLHGGVLFLGILRFGRCGLVEIFVQVHLQCLSLIHI